MNSDLTFITNEKKRTLLDRFRVLIRAIIEMPELERFMKKSQHK